MYLLPSTASMHRETDTHAEEQSYVLKPASYMNTHTLQAEIKYLEFSWND